VFLFSFIDDKRNSGVSSALVRLVRLNSGGSRR
jgi:hypothetical protein